jgi:uncharacterized protein YecT (DUF1311 family)
MIAISKLIKNNCKALAVVSFVLLVFPDCASAEDCNPSGGVGLDSADASLQCVGKDQAVNDIKLNGVYKKLLKNLKDNPGQENFSRTQIVEAQRAWVSFRDKECDFRTSLNGGAHQWLIVNRTECLSELTEERTKVLAEYLKQATDDRL